MRTTPTFLYKNMLLNGISSIKHKARRKRS